LFSCFPGEFVFRFLSMRTRLQFFIFDGIPWRWDLSPQTFRSSAGITKKKNTGIFEKKTQRARGGEGRQRFWSGFSRRAFVVSFLTKKPLGHGLSVRKSIKPILSHLKRKPGYLHLGRESRGRERHFLLGVLPKKSVSKREKAEPPFILFLDPLRGSPF